nr:hypothetical protein [Tanacetum cinerariifolium]
MLTYLRRVLIQKHMLVWVFISSSHISGRPLSRSGTLIRQGSACDRDLRMLIPFRECLLVRGSITDIKFVLTQRALTIFCETYHIPDEVHPQLPSPNQMIHEMPSGKICIYTRFFEYANFRLPLSTFFTAGLFRCFYVNSKNKGCMSFSKRPGSDAVCYTKPLDSLKNWNIVSFGLTLLLVPPIFLGIPARNHLLCLVEISRYYTLDEDAYPEFLGDNDEEMDLLSFIRTADPTKVRVAERQRVENEPRLLKVRVPGGFSDVFGSDFLIGGIRTVVDPDSDLQKVYVPQWSATNGFGLDDRPAARQISLNAGVRMRAEYNIREKRKLRTVVDEQAELLKIKDGDIESLKAQLLLKEAKSAKAIRLRAEREREKNELSVKVTDLSASVKVREQEVADLDAHVTAVKLQNDNLVDQVHELEISSVGLQEKVDAYEDFIGQLEKFQDKKKEEVNEKFDKLRADFIEMALHLEEKFYSHLLTTISGRRWLLTHGMELAVIKCLNSTEYLSALGPAISKAVEKGMQEGLSAGITHGAEGRKLADVAAYNPSTEADYLSSLQRLQNVNFSLIAELKSNKDAGVDTIMNLLRLDDALVERMGLTESQPHANQLMVPIHHSPYQRVVGASALSLSLDVSHSWVKKMRENIARHVSALRGVFVPLSDPLSVATLEGTEGGAGVDDETVAVENIILFFDVSNTELNILE